MTTQQINSVTEAMNFAAIMTEACSRSGTASIGTNLLQDALHTKPQDRRVMKLAELFTAQMLGNKCISVAHEIADLTLELEAEAYIRQI